MNKKVTCLLRRLMIRQQLDQEHLAKMMQEVGYSDDEVGEVMGCRPSGDKLYVLHGYWNTEDTDGVKVVSISYDFEKARQKLEKIAENKASEFVSFPYDMSIVVQTERMFEMQDEVLAGTYAKFYITEEAADYD